MINKQNSFKSVNEKEIQQSNAMEAFINNASGETSNKAIESNTQTIRHTTKKLGAPIKDEEEKRKHTINVYCTSEEYNYIKSQAKMRKMKLSEYIRFKMFVEE